MADVIKIEELEFVKMIEAPDIKKRIDSLAEQINSDLTNLNPIFLVVLNGAFIFAADLLRNIKFDCDIAFVDAKSYDGLISTGDVIVNDKNLVKVKNRNIVIIEDIVDTGHTIKVLKNICEHNGASSFKVISFLSKPEAHEHNINVDYVGFEISKLFVVGYGLDYNNKGRNLKHIYLIRPFI